MIWLLIQREEGILVDGPFDIATGTLTSQSLLYLCSCDYMWSKDLCCKTIKTRTPLGKELKKAHLQYTLLLFSFLFKVYMIFTEKIRFLSIRYIQ